MAYSDQKFYARPLLQIAQAASFGTSTAGDSTGHDLSDVYTGLPKFVRRSKVNAIRVRCTTIPDAGSTAVVVNFTNGTDILGAVTVTTATAGQFLDCTMTPANSTFAADGQLTVDMTGTSTASGDANGSYDIWAEIQELFG